MKIAICEDEKTFSDQLVEYINEWTKTKSVFKEIFTYDTADKFLYIWEESEDFDIIFLDIKLGKINGLDIAKIIRRTNNNVAIVFVTIMKEFAIKGYAVSAMYFLQKPVRKVECFICLDKVYENNKIKKYYLLNDKEKTFKIPHEDIIYIKMSSHNAVMVTKRKEYTFRKTIINILGELRDDLFIRCHKSYIINLSHIEAIYKTYTVMSNEKEIPLSKDTAKNVNEKFIKYNVYKV